MNHKNVSEIKEYVNKAFHFLTEIPTDNRFSVKSMDGCFVHREFINGTEAISGQRGFLIPYCYFREGVDAFAKMIGDIVANNKFVFLRYFSLTILENGVEIYIRIGYKKTLRDKRFSITDFDQFFSEVY